MVQMGQVADGVYSVMVGIGGALALNMFYRQTREEWPSVYATIRTRYDLFRTRLAVWHIAQRTLPLAVAAALTTHVARELDLQAATAGATLFAVHIGHTNLRGIADAVRLRHLRFEVTAYQALLIPVLMFATYAGAAASEWLSAWFPSVEVLRDGFWVGLAVVLIQRTVVTAGSMFTQPTKSLLVEARARVDRHLEAVIVACALRESAPVFLLRAIVYAEALQRPRWLRRLEDAKSRIRRSGTYGIAQVYADGPLTDVESIDALAVRLRSSISRLQAASEERRDDLVCAYLEQHNPDQTFVQVAQTLLSEMLPQSVRSSEQLAPDGRPILEVAEVRRRGFAWEISGAAWGSPTAHLTGETSPIAVTLRSDDCDLPDRISWRIHVPLDAANVLIGCESVKLAVEPSQDRSYW